ncbi:hypothetical protein IQ254_11990 [Nodosilinea sp. LEGE 07088]|uniref:hypothetical protein n=1 Tax=Nodosilinea sp. LEGE 07088 TaxID=2777968 RepID=UPI00187F1CDD|nr:hypothetical protein [Nodosilinea sp. LEGE 07088]MBE9137904.1 hypothetical protein [Nodosilinea sp. LEGE 07088]
MAAFLQPASRRRPQRLNWGRFVRLMGTTLVCSTLLTLPGHQAQGQTNNTATVTEILDSNQVYIQNRAAQVNSIAQQRQQVRTRSARASLRFNTGAVARLAHNSSLVVGQCAQLNRGTLLVNGSLNGCSTSTVAGVRGTIYTLEVTEAGETIIRVFEGEVVVQRNPNPLPVDAMAEDFDPLDPALDPRVPTTDPVVPFVNPVEPPPPVSPPPVSPPPVTPPRITPPPVTPSPEVKLPPQFTRYPLVAATKQTAPPADSPESSPALPPDAPALPSDNSEVDTVDFGEGDSLAILEGNQVMIAPEGNQAVIATLSPDDFINLLEGPLIKDFIEIPGMSDLRRSFEQLFPGVPLPYYWVPQIPSPSIRFPFPF